MQSSLYHCWGPVKRERTTLYCCRCCRCFLLPGHLPVVIVIVVGFPIGILLAGDRMASVLASEETRRVSVVSLSLSLFVEIQVSRGPCARIPLRRDENSSPSFPVRPANPRRKASPKPATLQIQMDAAPAGRSSNNSRKESRPIRRVNSRSFVLLHLLSLLYSRFAASSFFSLFQWPLASLAL